MDAITGFFYFFALITVFAATRVVTARNPNPAAIHQPLATVISDWMGVTLAQPVPVDLSEIDAAITSVSRAGP